MVTFTLPCPKAASTPFARVGLVRQNASPSSSLSLSPGFLQGFNRRQTAVWKVQAQLSKVTATNSNSVPVPATKSAVGSTEGKDESPKETTKHNNIPDPSAISAFMAQVSDLVKLVDSRDIVELELKQLDCEVTIRKKEALEQPAPQFSIAPLPTHPPHAAYHPSQPLPPAPVPAPAATPAPAGSPSSLPGPASPAPPKASTSSHPPLKCPMAGTFYRSPAPGEPPFVKVGDKVQKGQVICIIEAMKLMNEIEADQTGTIAEMLVEDGKPVSVDSPLFVIVP